MLRSLKKFIDGFYGVEVPDADKVEIARWVHAIPDTVMNVKECDIVPFWDPRSLPCSEAADVKCSGTGGDVEEASGLNESAEVIGGKQKVLQFGKMTAEVTAEKNEKGLNKKKSKKRKRKQKKGK